MDGTDRPFDYSMFTRADVVNLCHQRTQRTRDFVADPAFAQDGPDFEALKPRIMDTVMEEIEQTFALLAPTIDLLAPGRVADIGSGYAFFDLFLHRRYGCKLLLIDIEETEEIYFAFKAEGAGYNNLGTARRFLEANGVPADAIETVNPKHQELSQAGRVDLALSLISCGFHYPVETYDTFFSEQVDKAIMLDIRGGTNGHKVLDGYGPTRIVRSRRKYSTVVARKW